MERRATGGTTNGPRRPAWRRRLLAVGAVLALLALSLAVLTDSALATWLHTTLRQALHHPTATPSHAVHPSPSPVPHSTLGANRFYWEHAAPWGTLLVDGQAGPNLNTLKAAAGVNPPVPSFTLAPGAHTLDYRADPLPEWRCVVSVPAAASDTCPLAQPMAGDIVSTADSSRILDLRATPDHLSSDQQATLAAEVQAILSATTPTAALAVGDHYLAADGSVATASAAMNAAVIYALNTDASHTTVGGQGPCLALCVTTGVIAAPSDLIWHVTAHVVVRWQYRLASNGALVLDAAPAAPNADDAQLLLPVDIRLQGGQWHVQVPALAPGGASLPCGVATQMRYRLVSVSANAALWRNTAWGTFPAAVRAQGCLLLAGSSAGANGSGEPLLLYRCGVLLAANDAAKSAFPTLPVASSGEQSLARQLAPAGVGG